MTVCNSQVGVPNLSTSSDCGTTCSSQCADFILKRHDTQPAYEVSVETCDGPMDLTDPQLVVEANMWVNARFKTAITHSDTYFRLADDIGFEQVMQDDIIVIDRARLPEQMLVTGFDETNKLIRVQRGYHGTIAGDYKKGTAIKIFRILNGVGETRLEYDDILNTDGTTTHDQLTASYLVYNWQPADTCVAGCFMLEFKLLQLEPPLTLNLGTTIIPSFTPSTYTPVDFGCRLGTGVLWERRFPVASSGFVIQIVDTPTSELMV